MLVGATLEKTEISYWQNKVLNNGWMRVFPNSDGLIPVTSDQRYEYAADHDMKTIFVSSKVDKKYSGSYSAGLDIIKTRLIALVDSGDFDMIYYTEHHEPEADYPGSSGIAEYKSKQLQMFAMVDSITPLKRAKIKCGSTFTRQWVESNASGKGKYNYKLYDTGQGDFFGVDMYHDSWKPGTDKVMDTASIRPPDSFLQYFKAYRYDGLPIGESTDTRIRCFPELGMIGFPEDTDGSKRAAWIQGIQDQVSTWGPSTTGWPFAGWIWWNTEGKSGASLVGAGTKRWFQLDRRHTGSDGSYVILSTPKALIQWNSISDGVVEEPPPPPPSDDPDPEDPQYILGFAAGVASVEAQLQTRYDDGYEDGLAAGQGDLEAATTTAYNNGYAAGYAAAGPDQILVGRQQYHDEVITDFTGELPPVNPS